MIAYDESSNKQAIHFGELAYQNVLYSNALANKSLCYYSFILF